MTTSYNYSIASDFTNATQVNTGSLQQIITADNDVSVDPLYINGGGDDVEIVFLTALDASQKTALDNLISAYVFAPNPQAPAVLSYNCLVSNDPNFPGDFTTISAALANGKFSIFIKNGTYVETSDLVLPDGALLRGEVPGKVVVFLAGATSMKIDGSSGVKETTGTISVSTNASTVIGTGTSFTSLSPGNFILIGTNYYKISSIESDTSLTLSNTYAGNTVSSSTFVAQSMHTGTHLSNLIIVGSVYIRALRHGSIEAISVTSGAPNIEIIDSGDLSIGSVVSSDSTGDGIRLTDNVSLSFNTINVFNCTANGITVDGDYSANINILAAACENNNGKGIEISSSGTSVCLSDSVIRFNNSSGIDILASGKYHKISSCDVTHNNGSGIVVRSTNTSITGCTVSNNATNGIDLENSHNVVSSNMILNNTGKGVYSDSASGSCTFTGNVVSSNLGGGLDINGKGSVVNANTVTANTGIGIQTNSLYSTVVGNSSSTNTGSGIKTLSSNCIFTSNTVDANQGDGIEIATGVAGTIVSTNIFTGNSGTNLLDNGTGTVLVSNTN